MTFCACVINAPTKFHNQQPPKQEFDSIMDTSNMNEKERRGHKKHVRKQNSGNVLEF